MIKKIIVIIFFSFLQTGFANTVSDSINHILTKKSVVKKVDATTTEKYHTFDAYNRHFSFVLFYRSSCPHCQRFAPVLSQFSKDFGFQVYAYTTDGNTLLDFPESMNATSSIEKIFFQGNNIVVPSLFLVNVKTMQAYLIDQGEMGDVKLQNTVMHFFSNMSAAK